MVFLDQNLWFPNTSEAEEGGLLAVGGDMNTDRLLLAYRSGIFPWFIEQGLIFWFCPAERFVLYPEEIHVSHSMKQIVRKQKFTVTENWSFRKVIENCASVHKIQSGSTWVSKQFVESYTQLHHLGYAKSVEVWEGDDLIGGLYGVEVGNIFCGESMFSRKANASKLALIHLCRSEKYQLIDCQVYTEHLESLGARLIDREVFLEILKKAVSHILSESKSRSVME